PAITTGNMSSLGITLSDLRNIHSIVGLQLYILRCVLALDHILVIEGEPGSRAIRVLPQHINRFLLRKIAEAAGHGEGIENRRRISQRVKTWFRHLSQNIEFLAVDLLYDYCNFRLGNVTLEPLRYRQLELMRSFSGGLYFSH